VNLCTAHLSTRFALKDTRGYQQGAFDNGRVAELHVAEQG
jgi:hypothetical protein